MQSKSQPDAAVLDGNPDRAGDDRGLPLLGREAGRFVVITAMAFLTLVDLFGTQAILPTLASHYGATPAQAGLAVNATTLGMAIASLGIAFFARRIDRRMGVVWSLCALAVPTALLAFAPNLQVFAALRVAQGLCMASAFVLTLAYLGEHTTGAMSRGPSPPTSPATSRAT